MINPTWNQFTRTGFCITNEVTTDILNLLQAAVSSLGLVIAELTWIEAELYKLVLYEEGAFFYRIAIPKSQLVYPS